MLSDWILRARALFKRPTVEREIDGELRFHMERQVESYLKAGLDRDEALRRARLEFGGLDQAKEEYRDALGIRVVDNLGRDLRLAARALCATPVVSAAAVLSLTLGIGANTAIFSLVNSLLLRQLPVQDPERLAIIVEDDEAGSSWTNPIWEDIRSRSDLFAGTFAWATDRFDLTRGGEAQLVEAIWASGSFFDVLGVPAIVGRTLTIDDDRRGGGPNGAVVVIGYDFWLRQFDGAADVVGRQITLQRVPFTIVGVTPPGFFGPDVGRRFDVIVPLGVEPLLRGKESQLDEHWSWWLNIMVRLKQSQTIEAAEAALFGIQSQIRKATLPGEGPAADSYMSGRLTLAQAATGRSPLRVRYQRPLLTILVVVGLVLLIACANIANLLLARATARRHELSVRLALGASRWRLTQQLLAESVVLASIGAVTGLLFAQWGSRLIVGQLSTHMNLVFLDLAPDWRVLGFTTALTVLTALVFGTVPALRASRVAPVAAMKEGGRMLSADRKQVLSSSLVVVQVALSLMLVIVAGLFVRTFVALATRPLGLDAERVLVVNVNAPQARFGSTDIGPLFERVRMAVAATPGVAQAATSLITPVTGGGQWNDFVTVEGSPRPEPRKTYMNAVTPNWFVAVGAPLLAGRDFSDRDRANSPRVAIVNHAFARQFGLGANAVGRTVVRMESSHGERLQIVGVAADAVYRLLREPMMPTMYVPLEQLELSRPSSITLNVRAAAGSPELMSKSIGAAIADVSPDLVLTFRPLEEQVNATLVQERLLATLSGFFGVLAVLLASIGLYGITSYAVSRRQAEIGIRMALGAAPTSVIRLVLSRLFILVAIGVVIGVTASAWASQFVANLLYGLEPRDPATLVGAALVLGGVTVVAGWAPALRAVRIDPSAVLRES